jgi:CrcB protein
MEFRHNRLYKADDSYRITSIGGSDLIAYFWVALGGILGACARYALARFVAKVAGTAFPYGTLLINLSGSLLLGFFMIWSSERAIVDNRLRLFLAIGFCGAYTTFSSFAFESFAYFEQGHWMLFAANVLSNNVLCLLAVIVGAVLARSL